MAVSIRYVVVRDGVEKMTFASKKEADAYDRMLDLADNLSEWLAMAPLALDETVRESLSFYLAEQKEALGRLLRGASASSLGEGVATVNGEMSEACDGDERENIAGQAA